MTTIILVTAVVFLYVMGFLTAMYSWKLLFGRLTKLEGLVLFFLWWGTFVIGIVLRGIKK